MPNWQERERAVAIARAQLDQLLSKLPPVPVPRKDLPPLPPPVRSADRARVRHEMLIRHIDDQRNRCAYCGNMMGVRFGGFSAYERRATLDHVIPKCRGGRDTLANTVAACSVCNAGKADMMPDEYQRLCGKRATPPENTKENARGHD